MPDRASAASAAPRGGAAGATFRAQLEQLIARAGSQERLARECGLSLQTVNDWKNGKSLPGFEQLRRLSDQTGVTLDWLCYNRGPESPSVSRPRESLQEDLARHVIEAVARDAGLPLASAQEDLRIDAEWLLTTVTAGVVERFRTTRRKFEAESARELRSLQAIHYLERFSSLLVSESVDEALRDRASQTLLRLTESLLSDIPDMEEQLTGQPGVWFARSSAAYAALLPGAEALSEALASENEHDAVLEAVTRLEGSRKAP